MTRTTETRSTETRTTEARTTGTLTTRIRILCLVALATVVGCTLRPADNGRQANGLRDDGVPSVGALTRSNLAVPTGRLDSSVLLIEKTHPTRVNAGQPFEIHIEVGNLTDEAIHEVVLAETIPSHVQVIRSFPPAMALRGEAMRFPLGTIGPRSRATLQIAAVARNPQTFQSSTAVTYGQRLDSTIGVLPSDGSPINIPVTPSAPLTPTEGASGNGENVTMETPSVTGTDTEVVTQEWPTSRPDTARTPVAPITTPPRPSGLVLHRSAPMELRRGDKLVVRCVVENRSLRRLTDLVIAERPTSASLAPERQRIDVLPPRARIEVQWEIDTTGQTTYEGSCALWSGGAVVAESSSSKTHLVGLQLELTGTAVPNPTNPRGFTHEFTVHNRGSVVAENVILDTELAAGANLVERTPNGGSGTRPSWRFDRLLPGDSHRVVLQYEGVLAGKATTLATVRANGIEPVEASAASTIAGISAVEVTIVEQNGLLRRGDEATYVIEVRNVGTAIARDVQLNCWIRGTFRFISARGVSHGTLADDMVRFQPILTLPPGQVATWSVELATKHTGYLRVRAAVTTRDSSRPVIDTVAARVIE